MTFCVNIIQTGEQSGQRRLADLGLQTSGAAAMAPLGAADVGVSEFARVSGHAGQDVTLSPAVIIGVVGQIELDRSSVVVDRVAAIAAPEGVAAGAALERIGTVAAP